jgi:hypothetical protein
MLVAPDVAVLVDAAAVDAAEDDDAFANGRGVATAGVTATPPEMLELAIAVARAGSGDGSMLLGAPV